MRIVADTNVIVSALLWRKHLAWFADLINEKGITLCFSTQTINELYRVAGYEHIVKKSREDNIDIVLLIDKLLANSVIVYHQLAPSIIADDPADNHFLACALSSGAAFIISGDKHLLALKSFRNIPILTPRQFLNRLKKQAVV